MENEREEQEGDGGIGQREERACDQGGPPETKLIFFLAVIYARYLKQLSENLQKKLADASATAEEAISSIRTV
jgi:hypothetical protein